MLYEETAVLARAGHCPSTRKVLFFPMKVPARRTLTGVIEAAVNRLTPRTKIKMKPAVFALIVLLSNFASAQLTGTRISSAGANFLAPDQSVNGVINVSRSKNPPHGR
jgi:hypothetical protein